MLNLCKIEFHRKKALFGGFFLSEASDILSFVSCFVDRADVQIVAYVFVYLYFDSVSDAVSFEGFADRGLDADAVFHGISTNGCDQLVFVYFTFFFKFHLNDIIHSDLVRFRGIIHYCRCF